MPLLLQMLPSWYKLEWWQAVQTRVTWYAHRQATYWYLWQPEPLIFHQVLKWKQINSLCRLLFHKQEVTSSCTSSTFCKTNSNMRTLSLQCTIIDPSGSEPGPETGSCVQSSESSDFIKKNNFNPLNPQLNPICHLLALLEAHHILHVSRIRVNDQLSNYKVLKNECISRS